MSYHRQIIERSDRRRLCLYSKEHRSYRQFEGLPAIDSAPSHLRRHPRRTVMKTMKWYKPFRMSQT